MMKNNNKKFIATLLYLISGAAYSFVLPVPVVPITGVSLIATATSNIGIIGINSTRIPFLTTLATNTGIIYKEKLKSIKKNTRIQREIQKNRLKNETHQMLNVFYDKDKLSGSTWTYKNSKGKEILVDALDASNAIKDMKKNFSKAGDSIPFNISNILFNEDLGMGNGEMTTFDLSATSNGQLAFEIKSLSKIEKMKTQLIDSLNKKSRYAEYMNSIDETMTLKSSVDLKNLLAQEKLIKQKIELETAVNFELTKTYKNILKTLSKKQVILAAGKLHTFTIN